MHQTITNQVLQKRQRLLLAAIVAMLSMASMAYFAKLQMKNSTTLAVYHLVDLGITDYLFDDMRGRPLDEQSIRDFIVNVNEELATPQRNHLLSPWRHVGSRLVGIGEVYSHVHHEGDTEGLVGEASITRGGRERPVRVTTHLAAQWPALGVWGVMFLALSFILVWLVPAPLDRRQVNWLVYLRRIQGWSSERAIRFISEHVKGLEQYPSEIDRTDRLVSECGLDIEESVSLASDPDVTALNSEQFEWFLLGMRHSQGDRTEGLRIARSDPVLCVSPRNKHYSIHGLEVSIDHATLAVLAWYAMRRRQGDGWINNPPSNLTQKSSFSGEDRVNLAELIDIFEKSDVHSRSIDSISKGVTAKFLNNHRSKIRTAIRAALRENEQLIQQFDFDEQQVEGTDRRRYRLATTPEQIDIYL